jgi:hypothetical protein
MKIMQWGRLKILFIIVGSLLAAPEAFAQTATYRLKTADSLFVGKRYTQSFEQYESILKQHQYTSAMLLKMAYIQEGLNHVGQAMYYLNLYYLASRDKTAVYKMEELADKYRLTGYETTDADRALSLYHDYYGYISITLAAVTLLLLSLVFYVKVRRRKTPIVSLVCMTMLLAAFGFHLYVGDKIDAAIITSPHAYLMDGPSAGATLIEVVGDGHRVEVIGGHDVWLKIQWDNVTGYVRDNALQRVEL